MINENKRIGSCLCGSIKVFTSFEHVDLGHVIVQNAWYGQVVRWWSKSVVRILNFKEKKILESYHPEV